MYFTWKEDYSVNIEEIDSQHKQIFEIGRRVSIMVFDADASYSRVDIENIFRELRSYTEFHFDYEEQLLKGSGYAHYETHKHEHEMLIERIKRIEEKQLEKLHKDTLMELINLIFEWISSHILNSDKKYCNQID